MRSAVRTPNMNAFAERFVGTIPRELLDHLDMLGDMHPARLLCESIGFHNNTRPHEGIARQQPLRRAPPLG